MNLNRYQQVSVIQYKNNYEFFLKKFIDLPLRSLNTFHFNVYIFISENLHITYCINAFLLTQITYMGIEMFYCVINQLFQKHHVSFTRSTESCVRVFRVTHFQGTYPDEEKHSNTGPLSLKYWNNTIVVTLVRY